MKHRFLMMCLCLTFAAGATADPPLWLRKDLLKVAGQKDQVRSCLDLLASGNDALSQAYSGFLHAVMAGYAFFPTEKWSYFQRSRQLLESAVALQPGSAEIRSLRLLVQDRTPSWLGYGSERTNDLEFVLGRLERKEVTAEWAPHLAARLKQLKTASDEQRRRIEQLSF